MPNYFTHITFGEQVLDALPPALAASLREQWEAFVLGCLGPDPLFFYHPALPNRFRREGVRMHAQSARPAFQRLALAIRERIPMAEGYAAGFLCHYALDGACHGYINSQNAPHLAHLAMEAEADRRLMESRGLKVRGRVHLPEIHTREVFEAAATAYEQSGPGQLRKGYRAMRRDSWLFSLTCGRRRGDWVNWLLRQIPPCRRLDGIVLGRTPAPGSDESSRQILRRAEGLAPAAARQLLLFLETAAAGGELPGWFDRNFNGTPCLS